MIGYFYYEIHIYALPLFPDTTAKIPGLCKVVRANLYVKELTDGWQPLGRIEMGIGHWRDQGGKEELRENRS
jgi:hypothetical protein